MDKIIREMQMPVAHRVLEKVEAEEEKSNPGTLIERIRTTREKLNKIIAEKGAGDFFNIGIGAAGQELSQYVFKKEGRGINNISLAEIEEIQKKLKTEHYDAICLLVVGEAWEKSQRGEMILH